MTELSQLEFEVAGLIVDSLNLEDLQAGDIKPDESLFNEGLGLDSIDALELAMSISKKYGFQLRSDDPENVKIFSSLRALTEHIGKNREP